MSAGRVRVVGLGPGPADWRTPEADAALARASDVLGYGPYLDRLSLAASQRRHATDNREEIARARHALALAAEGADVALVSGGDPGIFAMAAALIEAAEAGEPVWRALDIEVLPGVSAMQAAAARLGAPLGPRFLRDFALRQSKTLGRRRAAPELRGGRRFRHHDLQSRLEGAAPAHSRRVRATAID